MTIAKTFTGQATQANQWINTADSDHPAVFQKAKNILSNNLYCSLSTCTPDGEPWISPLLFVYDENWNVYWSSAIISKHSQNIYSNGGKVAIAIYGSPIPEGTGQGLYLTGTAQEVENPEVAEQIIGWVGQRTKKANNKTASDYLGDSPRRFYRFVPTQVWVTGERILSDGQLVDTKVGVNFPNSL
ncbi:pyridoxamine 5'-phosphate oxidase family protein [Capilliphycus salinus ALCB114379]|uniref:pyridoxamine 5'-phosphate oxidase family protein n=1 Tax=Capilliphycus salinus TaxID=2768948 RepID=UPI0039A477B8